MLAAQDLPNLIKLQLSKFKWSLMYFILPQNDYKLPAIWSFGNQNSHMDFQFIGRVLCHNGGHQVYMYQISLHCLEPKSNWNQWGTECMTTIA